MGKGEGFGHLSGASGLRFELSEVFADIFTIHSMPAVLSVLHSKKTEVIDDFVFVGAQRFWR